MRKVLRENPTFHGVFVRVTGWIPSKRHELETRILKKSGSLLENKIFDGATREDELSIKDCSADRPLCLQRGRPQGSYWNRQR